MNTGKQKEHREQREEQEQKIVVITGAASGLGRKALGQLARSGQVRQIIAVVREASLKDLAASLEREGIASNVRLEAVDLVEPHSIDLLVERLSGRWMSPSGRVYHALYNPPKVQWLDDVDGSPLYQRDDDKPETVQHRIDVYKAQTAPLIDFFQAAGVLVEVDGTQDIDRVTEDILNAIGSGC
mgnify:CR=1 FL=1